MREGEGGEIPTINVSDICKDKYYNRKWYVEAIAVGENDEKYLCPLEIKITCRIPCAKCKKIGCPVMNVEGDDGKVEAKFSCIITLDQ